MDLIFARKKLPGFFTLLLIALSLSFTNYAMAQDDDDDQDEAANLDKVVVTGSRISRSGFDTMMPTTVIDIQFVEDGGATNLADVLNELPSFGAPLQSTQGTQSLAGVGAEFVDFYGLGSQRTLTLVNGRRFVGGNSPTVFTNANPGLQVDFNMIPSSMVERVEIVSIGGAPIYGADAIAGTVNVIMKEDYEGLEMFASKGWSDQGGMEEDRFTAVVGGLFADGRGSLMAGIEWTKREGLIESEREHLARGWQFQPPPAGSDSDFDAVLIEDGHANLLSNGGTVTPTFFMWPNIGLGSVGTDANGNPIYLEFKPDGSIGPFDVGQPTGSSVWSVGGGGLFLPDVTALFSPVERTVFSAFGNYEIHEYVEAFGEFFYANSKTQEITNQAAYQSWIFGDESFALVFSADHPLLTDSARSTLDQYGLDTFWINKSQIDLRDNGRGGNGSEAEVNMWRAVGGLRGSFAAANRFFDWDVTYIVGNSDSYTQSTDISSQRFFFALDAVLDADGNPACRVTVDPSSRPTDPANDFAAGQTTEDYDDCVPLDIFGNGRASPEALAYIQRTMMSRTSLQQVDLSANITFGLMELPAGEWGIAGGYEHREENADFNAGGWAQSGYGRSTPVNSVAGGYKTDELYVETYLPIVSPDMDIPLVHSASVEGAFRRVDNSRAGKDDAWTVGGRWAPIQSVEFRGNVTRSVRAPAVTELFLPRSGVFSFARDPCDARYVNEEPNRKANCIADGVPDPDNFTSNVTNASVLGVTGGNQNLQNEKADAWTAGVIFRPSFAPGLQLAIDYVDIDLTDSIESFTLTQVMESCYDQSVFPNSFCSQFTRLPNGQLPTSGAFEVGYVNAGQRVLKAYTAEGSYSFPAFGGNFNTTLFVYLPQEAFTRVLDSLDDSKGEPDTADIQAQLNVRYSRGDWAGNVRIRYIDKARINNDDTPTARDFLYVPSQTLVSAMVSYNLSNTVRLQANVNNLFDTYPHRTASASGWEGVYNQVGRYYRLGIEFTF
jgi:outer membrane receptor protein involved in Fe transport